MNADEEIPVGPVPLVAPGDPAIILDAREFNKLARRINAFLNIMGRNGIIIRTSEANITVEIDPAFEA